VVGGHGLGERQRLLALFGRVWTLDGRNHADGILAKYRRRSAHGADQKDPRQSP
jgi:hypothetical protein